MVVRPTVVFGERNRGNVYNLLKQVVSGRFVMIGNGLNRKSMAYVENVAAFIDHSRGLGPGVHIFNYIDKPDFSMSQLTQFIQSKVGRKPLSRIKIPFWFGYLIGKIFDICSVLTGRKFAISAVRVRKFCANSVYSSAIDKTGFVAPVSIEDALERTLRFEFMEDNSAQTLFFTE